MNHRNVCIVGLAAVAAVLAGCADQYRNPNACVAQMRSRLDQTSQGELKVTHRSVSYRGLRVVVEGQIEGAAVASAAASGVAAQSAGTQTTATALAATGSETAPAASTSPMTSTASRPSSGAGQPASASAPAAASAPASAPPQPKPTTPVGKLVAHFSHPKKTRATAAECTFDASGLKTFRWLAPADLAKTTPAPQSGS